MRYCPYIVPFPDSPLDEQTADATRYDPNTWIAHRQNGTISIIQTQPEDEEIKDGDIIWQMTDSGESDEEAFAEAILATVRIYAP